jgi:hypothetical protein
MFMIFSLIKMALGFFPNADQRAKADQAAQDA